VCNSLPLLLTAETFEIVNLSKEPKDPKSKADKASEAARRAREKIANDAEVGGIQATLGGEKAAAVELIGKAEAGKAVLRFRFDRSVDEIARGLTELPLLLVAPDGKTASRAIRVAGDAKACNAVMLPDKAEVTVTSALADGLDKVPACGGRVVVQVNGTNLDRVAGGELMGVRVAPMAAKTAKAISFAFDMPRFGRGVPLPQHTVLRMFDDAGKARSQYSFSVAECPR
jgi:hypothetical protein